MADNKGAEQQKEMVGAPKPSIMDAPIMGADSLPVRADAQNLNPKNFDSSTRPLPDQTLVVQGAVVHQKTSSGNFKPFRDQKPGSKRNSNTALPTHVPLPYNRPSMPPMFHSMVHPQHSAMPGYVYQPYPGPFSGVATQTPTPGQSFAPPVHYVDASRSGMLPPRGDPNYSVFNFSNRRTSTQEPGGHLNHAWRHQRAFNPSLDQQNIRQRPAFFGPPGPGYMLGPSFPGPEFGYVPIASPGSIRGAHPQHFVSYPINSGAPTLPPTVVVLKANIVKQIEYYFSDKNLLNDHYLISLMDGQGWVPISMIADFKRVKRMSTDIPFILDALQSSSTVEVQGDMIRRRDEWSKWIPTSAEITLLSTAHTEEAQPVENVADTFGNCDSNGDITRETLEANVDFLSTAENSVKPIPASRDSTEVTHNSTTEHCCKFVHLDGGKQAFCAEKGDLTTLISKSDIGTSYGISCQDQSQVVEPASFGDHGAENLEPSLSMAVQNLNDLSTEFAITLMLDEELEIEQKTMKKDVLPSARRIDDEDDETIVNDQVVQRLVIVTQTS